MPTQADLDAAQAQVGRVEVALHVAQNNLQAATLISPADGTVASVNGAVGQWLSGGAVGSATATTGTITTTTGFITLADVTAPQVTAQISEADIGKIRPGQKVNFTVSAFPGRTFTGKVARIEPIGQTVSNVVNYNVISIVDPTDVALLPSMTTTITIVTDQKDDVTILPNAAISFATTQGELIRQATAASGAPGASASPVAGMGGRQGAVSGEPGAGQGQRGGGQEGRQAAAGDQAATGADPNPRSAFVLVLGEDGQPVPRRIQVGSSDERNTQVISGLQPGDLVATGVLSGEQQTPSKPQTGGGGLIPLPGGGGGRPGGGGGGQPAGGGGGQPAGGGGAAR